MPNHLLKFLTLMFVTVFAAGCGMRAQQYVQVRERVDQQVQGNAGYLSGAPQPEDRSNIRKTRKVYVLEFSKEGGEAAEEMAVPEPAPAPQSTNRYRQRRERVSSPTRVIPDFEEPAKITEYQMYTVEKNDTLQKISKKFYDGYSKWPRIYEANKDVIKDPNRIKPGTTLKIPFE